MTSIFQLSPLLADFIEIEKCQQTLTPTFNQSCSVLKIDSEKHAIVFGYEKNEV